MNKKIKIFLITIGIIVGIIIISIIFFQNRKYNNKKTLTPLDFKTIIEKENYIVEDVTEEYKSADKFKTIQKAYKENEYELYFITFTKKEDAIEYADYYKKNTKYVVSGFYNYKYISYNSYSHYTLTSDNNYLKIIRLKETIIYFNVNPKYKNEINNTIKELNY